MSNLFISDLHLDENRPEICAAFYQFLNNEAQKADELYILGDFFEIWLGDDHQTTFNQEVINALADLETPIFIMHGNRDFLLGGSFCEQTSSTLLVDPTVIDINGEPILLMHGDSLCTQDKQYMLARQQLRDENFQRNFLSKTIAERQVIADSIRDESKELTRETADNIMDVTPTEVEMAMTAHHSRTLIHGHTHRPGVHDLTLDTVPAQRIVLGDWDRQGWFLESSRKGFNLVPFEIV